MNFKETSKEELEHQAREIRKRKVEEYAARLLLSVFIIGMLLVAGCIVERV